MGGFLQALAWAALAAAAVIWLRRRRSGQITLPGRPSSADHEQDQRRIRALAEAVRQWRSELEAYRAARRDAAPVDERVDALWSERERLRSLEPRLAALEQARNDDAARTSTNAEQIERMSAALDALRDEVAAAHAQMREIETSRDAQLNALRGEVAVARAQLQADQSDRADQIDAIRRERERTYTLEQQLAQTAQADGAAAPTPSWRELDPPTSFAALTEQVRSSLPYIALPDSALAQIGELDQSESAPDWAAETWRALSALSEYASQAARADTAALPSDWDFSRWCSEGGHPQTWPSARIGIDRERRVFSVDRGVNWSGQVVAQTHLLVGNPPDAASPVVFMHDDARGRTGRVHVVFLGPQRYAAAAPVV